MYDLSEAEAQRSGEYKGGIGRLLEIPGAALAPEVAAYVHLVRESAGAGKSAITAYPGSPLILSRMRRPADRLVLAETHAKEAHALRTLFGRARLVSIVEGDGYAALKAQLPPRENRGLVLIDPSYESDQEFDRILAALELRLRALADRHVLHLVPAHRACRAAAVSAQPRTRRDPQGARCHAERAARRRGRGHAGSGCRRRQSAVDARRTIRSSCCPTCIACWYRTAPAARASSGGQPNETQA